jgi:23S rRNA (cytidine1920-2'-O)/16S rRNA (cytidine1409-2'-O)-methyltransferase
LLVGRGLAETRAKAQAMIMAGEVKVAGKPILKAGTLVLKDADLSLSKAPLYISRGGIKLAYALEQFKLDVSGKVALDVGSSTGGFTDCLLQNGVSKVYAVDVGHGQLDYRLRRDSRVVVKEGTNARYPLTIPEKVYLATIDVSFISVEKVIPNILKILSDDGFIVVLIKPQFEADRYEVGKGGIITDPEIHAKVLGRFINWVVNNSHRLCGLMNSPIRGSSGNREFLVLLRK